MSIKKLKIFSVLYLLISLAFLLLLQGKTSAATINVVAGTDAIDANGQCQLSEAIQNINDQDTTNADCIAGDGNDDTINLPSGTITLTADLPETDVESIAFIGQGIGESIVSGAGQYSMFQVGSYQTEGTFTLEGLTITEFNLTAIATANRNVILDTIEIDGANSNPFAGTLLIMQRSGDRTVSVRNLYAHDLAASQDGEGIFRFINGRSSTASGTMNLNLNNVTLDQLYSSENNFFGGSAVAISTGDPDHNGSNGTVQTNLNIRNVTINDMSSVPNGKAVGLLSISSLTDTGTASTVADIANLTLNNVQSGDSLLGVWGGGLNIAGSAGSNSGIADTTVSLKNSYISNIEPLGNNIVTLNCNLINLNSIFQGTGPVNLALSSLGGNISDDTSCASSFTDPTDQNNVDAADLHLGTLGDYGGSVPTIPLGQGSIAIDAGVTVPGLTTDARGVSRPQCSAYDSGAYEYNGICPTPPSSQPLTTTVSNNTTSYLILPSGISNPSFTTTPPSSISSDSAYSYPAGLVSFQFDTEQGATKTITLYFDLPGDPNDYTARKYNTTTKAFTTIPNASITRATYNNQSMLKLTYNITDGGILDQDNQVNGTIVDPVGLAQTKTIAPNTGVPTYWLMRVKG